MVVLDLFVSLLLLLHKVLSHNLPLIPPTVANWTAAPPTNRVVPHEYPAKKWPYRFKADQIIAYTRRRRTMTSAAVRYCYACTYHLEEGEVQGTPACADPFNGLDVPRIECSGPCSKYEQRDGQSVMILRDCLPKCREKTSKDSNRICCHNSLCNRAITVTSPNATAYLTLVVSILLSFFSVQLMTLIY